MEKELVRFREDVDAWVKEIRCQVSSFMDVPSVVTDNLQNIEHNYELINELKVEIEELKQELKMQRLMQMILIKQKVN